MYFLLILVTIEVTDFFNLSGTKNVTRDKLGTGIVNMWSIIENQQKLVPEVIDLMRNRLEILQQIEHYQPIGRRALARQIGQTERVLRSEVDLLKDQGLIDIQAVGMLITYEGKKILNRFYPLMLRLKGFHDREIELARRLQVDKAFIVPGDSALDANVQREMGRLAAHYLLGNLRDGDRIAVTGGTTMAMLAEMLYSEQTYPDVLFMPARGGLGEFAKTQANSIVAELASKLGAQYVMLQIPDHLSSEAYHSLIEEPYIRERLEKIRSARMVFHGVGNALAMAEKRAASNEVITRISECHAVSEAFGAYFDAEGKLVYQMPTIGLRPEDLQNKHCIAVAGGSDKASAIRSLAKTGIFQVLITDEGSATELLK